jgi:hypothetical protein
MRMMTCYALAVAATCAPFAACVQPAPPVQPVPAGPTPDEVADYATAQARYRYGQAVGDGDVVRSALYTFSQIPGEILSRQDPKLFAAQLVCESQREADADIRNGTSTSFEPRFRYECVDIEFRYTDATAAIRRDLEARAAAADQATIAQAGAGHP